MSSSPRRTTPTPDAQQTAPTEAEDALVPAEQRLADHGLISTHALAQHYSIQPASVRKLMSENGIAEVRGYPAEQALTIQRPGRHPKPGPGRGHRKPRPGTEHAPEPEQ